MFTKEQNAILTEIKKKFDEIEDLYNQFDHNTQDYIYNYHNPDGSLPHCIRWGLQAAEDFLEEGVVFEIGQKLTVKSVIEFEDGYVPEGTTATIELIHYDQLLDEESEPFQLKFNKFQAFEEENEAHAIWEDVSLKFIKENLELV